MSGRAEAIQEELEALESMYPEGLRVALAAPSRDGHDARAHTTVALDVVPRTLDDETRQYVRVTLRIVLDNDYPAGAPSLSLTDAKGLDDARLATVMGRLRDAAAEHAAPGDPVLALLCETAFETLTELNHPDGDCAFCLEPMWRADHPADHPSRHSAEAFTKLATCYHCFHASCFARWYRWRAAAAAEEDATLGAHPLGSEEATSRSKRPTHLCPACRCAIDDADAARVRLSLTGVGGDDSSTGVNGALVKAVSGLGFMTEDDRAALRAQRARFEEAMERQRTAGGIVGDGDGEGIDLASASAASAAAGAAAGAGSNDGVDGTRASGGRRRSRRAGRGRKPGAGGGRGGGSGERRTRDGEVGGSIPGGGAGAGGGGLDWLKRAASSSAPFVPPAPNSSTDSVEVGVDGGRGGGRGRGCAVRSVDGERR